MINVKRRNMETLEEDMWRHQKKTIGDARRKKNYDDTRNSAKSYNRSGKRDGDMVGDCRDTHDNEGSSGRTREMPSKRDDEGRLEENNSLETYQVVNTF